MKKYLFGLIMLFFCATPSLAGMEPFWQGEFGSSPEEVRTRYNMEPKAETFELNDILLHNYLDNVLGQPVTMHYSFRQSSGQLKTVMVPLKYENINNRKSERIINDIINCISLADVPGDPYETALKSNTSDDSKTKEFIMLWLNKTMLIQLSVCYKKDKKELNCTISFNDVNDPLFKEDIAEDIRIIRDH